MLEDVEEGRDIRPVLDDVEPRRCQKVGVSTDIDDLSRTGSDVVDEERLPLSREQNDLAGVCCHVSAAVGSGEVRSIDPVLGCTSSHGDLKPESFQFDHVIGGGASEICDIGVLEYKRVRVDAGEHLEGPCSMPSSSLPL